MIRDDEHSGRVGADVGHTAALLLDKGVDRLREKDKPPAIFRQQVMQGEVLSELEKRRYSVLEPKPKDLAAIKMAMKGAEFEEFAGTDELTGLLNGRALSEWLISAWAKYVRSDGKKELGLLFMDGNKFKTINDTYGHQVGDEVLIAIAQAMKEAARAQDIVVRYGGDEFVIAMESEVGEMKERGIVGREGEGGEGSLLYRINYHLDQGVRNFNKERKIANKKLIEWNGGGVMIGDMPMRVGGGMAFASGENIDNSSVLIEVADNNLDELKEKLGLERKKEIIG